MPETTAEPAEGAAEGASSAVDTDNVQQGDQSGSDSASPQEETAAGASSSDGPGGYADVSPNADTQQEGEH